LRDEEAGYTIVEVMVAMVILVFGVLGTLVLMEGSLSSTSRTTAREQGTNLARDLVERSRQAAYADVTVSTAPQILRATLPASDGATAVTGSPPLSTFQVTRRNVLYTVTVFACSIDDPSDGDPDDLRRVRVDVSWDRGAASSVSQTTLLTNPTQA
jgi:Tfp pilus assembly protein PilV